APAPPALPTRRSSDLGGCPPSPRPAAGRRWTRAAPAGAPSGARPASPCRTPAHQAVPVAANAPIDRGTWTGLGVESPACGRHGASLPVASLLRTPFSGPEMPQGTLLYAQSGGVTAVINATASAVLAEGRARKVRVLAARNGILGALREELFDTSKETAAAVRALAHTPGGAF